MMVHGSVELAADVVEAEELRLRSGIVFAALAFEFALESFCFSSDSSA